MRKAPSMIQDGNSPCESPHLGDGDTVLAVQDRHATETFFRDLPARIATSDFRCGATTRGDRADIILCPYPTGDI